MEDEAGTLTPATRRALRRRGFVVLVALALLIVLLMAVLAFGLSWEHAHTKVLF